MMTPIAAQIPYFPLVACMPIAQLSKEDAGALLRTKREALRLTQEQVITEVGIPTITQLSEYENGKVSIARSKYFPGLARVLKLTEEDIRSINPSAVFDATPTAPEPAGRAMRHFADRDNPIPDALKQAAELHGKRYPELLDPQWQAYLAGFRWRDGAPDDPDAWLDLYRDLNRAGVVPGEN